MLPKREDKEIEEELVKKIEKIESFVPSGNIIDDFNKILELTGRSELYQKIDSSYTTEDIIKCFSALNDTWKKILKNPKKVNQGNKAKKLFYIDLPRAEIKLLEESINLYKKTKGSISI